MVKMYDFGADTKSVSANERRPFAWPVAIWSCYIPENESQDINILEHLILQLVNKGYKEPKAILCTKVGFNKELVEASLESCMDKGYFDRRYSEITLSEDGKKMLGKYDNPYSANLETSKKSKKVYMIQDLVTKSVIPIFNIEKLPQFYIEDDSAIEIHYDNFTGKKPRSASQKTAMRYWARLCHNKRKGLISGSNIIDVSLPPEKAESVDEFIPFEDEVDWETLSTAVNESEKEVITLADKEAEIEEQKQETNIKNLTIMDDSPEVYWARGFIAINRNAPDEIMIISPFGESLDDWFRTVINRLRTCDSGLEEELQLFLMLKRDELKDTIAFQNDLDIALFNEYPYVCNDPEYRAVKKTIMELTKEKIRFENGEDETIGFAKALRPVYEASLRLVVKNNPELFRHRELSYDDYKNNLRMLVNTYSFLDNDVYREYQGYGTYVNMTKTNEEEGYAAAFFALILMDAWANKNGKSMELLRNIPDLPIRIKELTSNSVKRSGKGENTAVMHGGNEVADFHSTVEKALRQYEEFENIFRAIYNRFMEGK